MNQINAKLILKGYYAITSDGRLYSIRSRKFLQPNQDKHGYMYFVVSISSVRTTVKAHRLVAQAFMPNPQNKPTVNHKNGVRTDNRIENLEWATSKEQARDPLTYKKTMALSKTTDYKAMGAVRNFGRKQVAVYKDGHLLGTYPSLLNAAQKHQANYSKASECANGKRKSVGGVAFAYVR